MKKLFLSTRYKKDFKRYQYNTRKLKALKVILNMLHGEYKGCMECHVEGDFLLIWVDPDSDIIELVRLGSHSELFGK